MMGHRRVSTVETERHSSHIERKETRETENLFHIYTPGGKIMARGTSGAVSVHLNHPTLNLK